MRKLIASFIAVVLLFVFAPTKAQNSGDRYIACTSTGCSTIGNEFCGYASTLNPDGTVTTYWCVITVVEAPAPDPPDEA
jgi:hypothetical protein